MLTRRKKGTNNEKTFADYFPTTSISLRKKLKKPLTFSLNQDIQEQAAEKIESEE